MFNGLNRKANKVRGSKAPFIKLPRHIKRSKAYHGLSVYARAALIELIDRYMGANNGMISLAVRELAEELNCGLATALAALRELDDAKLAHPTKIGAWRGKRASEWRITFLLCNKTGELPITNWEPKDARKRSRGETSGRVSSSRGETQSSRGETSRQF